MSKVQGNGVDFELHSLGWKSFQNLCTTIVAEIWGQTIQTFFDSRDGGRDGAFNGEWEKRKSESYSGTFTIQCKFTANSKALVKLSDLTDELKKAKRLAERGLANNYFLFTNANLTGTNDEAIRNEFENIPELKKCSIYGRERISQIIQESKRLRMLVPRIYGLGDLSQILDERAYDQASEILSSLGDDLNKYIITDAYRQSAKAIVEHGFVLLLGEPMCGKSTIAAALSIGALDEWGCSTIKVRDADDFVNHFNPNEKQLFWVDDAFGPTQLDWSSAINWSKTFPHVNAAIHKGAKVIFTSRDYIYKSAKKYLKESALPVIKESQVVIQVENLTKVEREQILYNHIKLGNQDKCYKKKIKPFLPVVSVHEKFSPEIARRLGNSLFTKDLSISKYGLNNFVAKPLDILCEVIETMDDSNRSALALVFIRGGILPSPLNITDEEEKAISRIGGNVGDVIKGLESLNGSFLINSIRNGKYCWHFKHPTIRDAFATVVASSQDLMDIYLTGAPLDKLLSEISCGDVGLQGVSVIVPENEYRIVIDKIKTFDIRKWFNKLSLCQFLSYRCDKKFLILFLNEFPDFISELSVNSYIHFNSDVGVLVRLHEVDLLPEDDRVRAVASIKDLAIDIPDSGFLRDSVKNIISDDELSDILHHVQHTLLPYLDKTIDSWRKDYTGEDEPDTFFEELKSTLDDYKNEFKEIEPSCKQIEKAITRIGQIIEDLKSEYSPKDDDGFWKRNDDAITSKDINNRSIFDDVDC
ncbi:MAG: hypothetical protein WD098_00210 [Balneolales bacterium]